MNPDGTMTASSSKTYKGVVEFSSGNRSEQCSKAVVVDNVGAEYGCKLNYDEKNNKLTITGYSSNNTKIAKTVIDGVETSSITPTTGIYNYSGKVYFVDGVIS